MQKYKYTETEMIRTLYLEEIGVHQESSLGLGGGEGNQSQPGRVGNYPISMKS